MRFSAVLASAFVLLFALRADLLAAGSFISSFLVALVVVVDLGFLVSYLSDSVGDFLGFFGD